MTAERYMDARSVAEYLSISRNMVDILVKRHVLPQPIELTPRLKRWDRLAIDRKLAEEGTARPDELSVSDISRGIADGIAAKGRLSAEKGARRRHTADLLPLAGHRDKDRR